MAVDALPGTKWFSALGFDLKLIPTNLNVPSGPSWSRLILWLLARGDSLPAAAIPDVVDLYVDWSTAMLGQDPLTSLIVPWLYQWLMEIDRASGVVSTGHDRGHLNDELTREQIRALAVNLRTGFLAFCDHCPDLAKSYLQFLGHREHGERTLLRIIKNSGALSKAAPRELAEITAELLIRNDEEDEEGNGDRFREAFEYYNMDFIPASPSQGPFLQLLIYAPDHGLKLVRRLIDHAISFRTEGRDFGANAIIVPSLLGDKTFSLGRILQLVARCRLGTDYSWPAHSWH